MPVLLPPVETPPGVTPPQFLAIPRKEFKQAVKQIDEDLADIEARKKQEAERKKLEEEQKEKKKQEEAEKKRKEDEERAALEMLPKAKVVIAADGDAIFDWQLRKMIVTIPMHQPARPYLERCLCEKMRWPDIVGYSFYKALGSSVDNVEKTEEPLQTNLTPTQLRMLPTGINFVMVRKAKRSDEEVLVSASEYFRYKVEKFLELYDPHRLPQASQLLRDNQGNEPALIDALLTRYGPEPTDQQIADKRAFLKKQKELADAAAERARQAGLTNSISTLSEREKENVMRIIEKIAFTRLQTAYYRKWRHHVIRRRLNKMIVTLSVAHLEKVRRKEYFGKLKMFAESRKNKRQLQASSQIAIKNEQLLGDLASQNMSLKNEIRKLSAHIEVLENASSKRLETLYAGSEHAVRELKRLTSELRNKAGYVFHLTVKEEQSKEKLAKAEALRDEAVAECEEKIREIEAAEQNYRFELRIADSQNVALEDKIRALSRDVAGTENCKHCPHYHEMVAQTTKNATLLDNIRSRIENSEASKRMLQDQIDQQRDDLANPEQTAKRARDLVKKAEDDKKVPQIFLDIEAAIRREREEEEIEELIRQGFAGQEALAKKRRERDEAAERDRQRQRLNKEAQQQQEGGISNNNNNNNNNNNIEGSSGGGDDDVTAAGASKQNLGGGIDSSISNTIASSQSILGPVGRADLSMARYFDNEMARSRSKFASSVQKQWTPRAITTFAIKMEEQRKIEATEALKQNQYHITRRQANQANAALLADSQHLTAYQQQQLKAQHNKQQQ